MLQQLRGQALLALRLLQGGGRQKTVLRQLAGTLQLVVGLLLAGLQLGQLAAVLGQAGGLRAALDRDVSHLLRHLGTALHQQLLLLGAEQPVQRRTGLHLLAIGRQHRLHPPGLGRIQLHRAQRLNASAQRQLIAELTQAHASQLHMSQRLSWRSAHRP